MDATKYTCNGQVVAITLEELNSRIDDIMAGAAETPPTFLLTEDQRTMLEGIRERREPGIFDIDGIMGVSADGSAFQRERCGTDVSELVAAVPEDGRVHALNCPRCQTEFTVRKVPTETVEADEES